MVSKKIVFIALYLAMVLLISSEVAAARELTESSNRVASSETEKTAEHGSYLGCGEFGCCVSAGPRCSCCRYLGEKSETEPPTKPRN